VQHTPEEGGMVVLALHAGPVPDAMSGGAHAKKHAGVASRRAVAQRAPAAWRAHTATNAPAICSRQSQKADAPSATRPPQ
jgi:hypothetical protein